MKSHFVAIGVIALALPLQVLMAAGREKPAPKPILCRGNYHSEEAAVKQLARMAATYSNLEEWKMRAAEIRKQILMGGNLDSLPERTPLNIMIHKKRSYDGYTVESAAFEARPGYFVYGNLYRPVDKKAPHPGILCPHGHARGPEGGRLRPDQQHRCATLARMGARFLLRHDRIRRLRTPEFSTKARPFSKSPVKCGSSTKQTRFQGAHSRLDRRWRSDKVRRNVCRPANSPASDPARQLTSCV